MCAIAGEISTTPIHYNEDTLSYLNKMLSTMCRRGPDATGTAFLPHAAFLHARLAVIDPEHGAQPYHGTRDGRNYTLIYNGELYNTEELRHQLVNTYPQITFDGHSDTELLLKALLYWGLEETLSKINGIFAFALWCEETRTCLMARDPIGVKPFFFTHQEGRFLFASEIKTILAHPKVTPVLGLTGLCEIFFTGPGRTPGCGVFEGIEELQPGECATLDAEGNLNRQFYWRLEDRQHLEDFEETAQKVRFLVTDAIERQLVSDVPIGTFLSGGLDSSIISAVSSAHMRRLGKKLQTFSVTYVDNEKYFTPSKFQPNSDEPYIQRMVEFLDSHHTRLVIGTEELAEALSEAVTARDLPGMADVDASMLLLCREIRKHVTVALSGECADEIFGGYPWYRDPEIRAQYGFPWAQSTDYRATFLAKNLAGKISPQDYVNARYQEMLAQVSKRPGLSPLEDRMREMVHLNTYGFMQTLLDRKDRMSMYSGLEVRVPFCDKRIAHYLYSTPWRYKDFKGREKGLLRCSMAGLLPDEILWRKKSPYPKTHNPAYTELMRRMLREILDRKDAPLLQIVDRAALEGLLTASIAVPWYGQLMTTPQTMAYFIQINDWLERYGIQVRC